MESRLNKIPDELVDYIFSFVYRCTNCNRYVNHPFRFRLIDIKNDKIACLFCI